MYGGVSEYIHRIGRTARIGNQGLATSFYNDRNEDIAQDLVNVLIECDCEVPEFLSHLLPEDPSKVDFGDDSDEEGEAGEGFGEAGGAPASGWGGADGGDAPVAAAGWGAPAEASADTGFTADSGAAPVSDW